MRDWMGLGLVQCSVDLRDPIKTDNGKACAYEGD